MKDFRVETILNCEDEQRNASSADDSDAKDGNVPAYKLEETNLSRRRRQQALKKFNANYRNGKIGLEAVEEFY